MKGRGIAALAAVAALVGQAAASFDLALVLDAGNRAVHRFDGDTGTYLGRIALPLNGTVQAMTLDQSTNRMFVSVGNSILAYNYNTGQLLFSNNPILGVSSLEYVQGTGLLIGATTNAVRLAANFSATNVTITSPFVFSPSSVTITGVGRDGTGDYLALSSAGTIYRGSAGTVEQSFSSLEAGARRLAVRGTQIMVANPTANKLFYGSSQNLGALSNSTSNLSGITAVQAAAFGHENVRYIVGRNAGNTSGVLHQFVSSSTGFPLLTTRVLGDGILDNPIDLAVVVAPEPGTMIALGAGVVALLRRRKK